MSAPCSPDTYLDAIYQLRGWRYAQAVVSGETMACGKARMACERFIREVHQSQSPLYQWRFDVELATRPGRFMEGFFVPTKGDYDRMQLLPWQCFCEENIYGWVDRETGLRRFREALICVGRGNGKSTLIGGNATFGVSKDNERGAEVGLFANSKGQASEMLDEIGAQIADSPVLAKRFKVLKSGILYEETHSRIRTFATNPKRLAGLNLHLAIFDEIYEYRSYKLLTQVRMSHIKRRQPLTFYISTKGTVLDGPLMRLYKLAQQVLAGHANPMVADRFFCFICEQESVEEFEQPDTWIKANPSLGVLIDKRDLFEAWQRAKESPEERAEFITKQFNVFSNASEMPFVTDDVLNRNRDSIALEILRGRTCYAGYDLSLREDFTSVCLLFPLDDGRFFCLSHSFVPRRKLELEQEEIDWRTWEQNGLLTVVERDYVDKSDVEAWLTKVRSEMDLRVVKVGGDPAQASQLVKDLEAKGFQCESVRQGALTLNEPMHDIHEKLLVGGLVTNDNPVMYWYLTNVKLREDMRDKEKRNWMPTRQGDFRKIDGFAAMLNAWTVMMRDYSPTIPQKAQVTVYDLLRRASNE